MNRKIAEIQSKKISLQQPGITSASNLNLMKAIYDAEVDERVRFNLAGTLMPSLTPDQADSFSKGLDK